MPQAKLVAYEPVLDKDGQHRKWNTANFPEWNYDFTLSMDNGDVGTAASKKPEGNYVIGKEYTYDKQIDDQGRIKLKKVKTLEAAAASGAWGKGKEFVSHYDMPDVQEAITRNFAMEQASLYLQSPHVDPEKITPESIPELSNAMYAWCYMDIDLTAKTWSKELLTRRNALKLAVTQIPIAKLKITSWKELSKRADLNYVYLSPKAVAEHV